MKKFYKLVAMIVAVLIVATSLPIIAIASAADNYIQYIDFGAEYAGRGTAAPNWRYIDTDANNHRAELVNNRIRFLSNTNSQNGFQNRAVIISNSRTAPFIASEQSYKIVFDLIVTDSSTVADFAVQFGYFNTDGIWSKISVDSAKDATAIALVEQKTENNETIYTLSTTITAPKLSVEYCNAALSIYRKSGNTAYYLDNVYIYEDELKNYNIYDENDNVIATHKAAAGASIVEAVKGTDLDKFGFDFTVTPSVYPENSNEKIVLKYQKHENVVADIDFNEKYAATDMDKYAPTATTHVFLNSTNVKFLDTCTQSVDFKDRAVLLANDYANSTVKAGTKYRIAFKVITWSAIDAYTLQIKYGSDYSQDVLAEDVTFDGATLKNSVISQQAQSDGSTIYLIEVELETPANWDASVKNLLVSFSTNATHLLLDNATIRTYLTYKVEDSEGKDLGTLLAFPGDKVENYLNDFYKEDYKCESVEEYIPSVSTEKIVLKYTEITNVLQYIDFGDSYAKGHREANGNPNWRYYTAAYVTFANGQMSFKGSNNSGTAFGNRGILLANNRTVKLIQAGKRYELQFELWLQGETLDSKNVDIRFGEQVWSDSAYSNRKASEFELVDERTDGAYNVYTLSTPIVSTIDTNIMISIYGNGSSNASIIDNVYIFEEFEYECVDGDGNPVGTITAFPGEKLADRIVGSSVDKIGCFEAPELEVAPSKPSTKIVIKYTADPSYVAYIDFGSTYSNGAPGWRHYTSAHTTYANGQMSFKGTNNAKQSYPDRAVLLNDSYSTSKMYVVANKRYSIQFELWLKGEELSSKTVDIRVDNYVWASANPAVTYSATADKFTLISTKTSGEYTVYTLSTDVVANKAGNFLMSVYGNGSGNASIIDNVGILEVVKVTFANTDLEPVVGRIGYDLEIPDEVIKKGYIFDGWYTDAEFTTKFTSKKFPEADTTIYASFTKVETEANMDFELLVPSAANLNGFKHILLSGNIYAETDTAGTAYLNMYKNSEAIRISPASYYPVYFKFKTSGYNGNITFGIASASKDDFNIANNVLSTITVKASTGWTDVSMCATPDILSKAGQKGDYLYFFVIFDSSKNGKIYVDDVEIRQETSFSFETNGGNTISVMKGEPGTSVTLPTPTNGNKVFSGWFYDSALTSKVADLNTVYPTAACNIKLYAGWDLSASNIMVEDFEAYNQSLIDDAANARAKEVFSVSNANAYSGNTSIKYKYDPANSKILSASESTIKLTNNGEAMKIEAGKKYIMTLYVYAKTLDSRVEIDLAAAEGNNIAKAYKLQTTAVGAARISNVFYKEGNWHKVQYAFTAATASTTANELFLSIRTTTAVYTELYIDNISIQEVTGDMSVVAFDDSVNNNSLADIEYSYILGNAGEKVKYPQIARNGHKVRSWHTAYNYKVLFSNEFVAGFKTAYVQYDIDGVVTVSFENSGHYSQDGVGTDASNRFTLTCGSKIAVGEKASKGNAAIKCDSNDKYWNGSAMNIALKDTDATSLRLVDNTTYIISVDIYVEKYTTDFSFYFSTGSQDNYFAWQGTQSGKMIVNQDVPTGQWITTTLTYSTAFSEPGGFNLFLNSSCPKGTIVYYDNVVIESIDSSEVVVVMNSGLVGGSTQRISGKIGDEYTLPANLDIPNYEFVGWYNSPTLDKQVDYEDFFVNTRTVYAKLVPSVTKQDFETYTDRFHLNMGGDQDYEIYDSTVAGNSAANVQSGIKSLHRKGNDYMFKNAVVITKSAQLSPGEVYEATMWVKLNSSATTDGAVKIGSCSSSTFAWDLTDDMKAVIAISDLTDKEWHKVTFKFMASAYFLAIQTPGYCDMFIDNVTVTYLGSAVPSEEVEYTEYIPIKKDENGNIPDIDKENAPDITDSKLEVYERLNELEELYGDYEETVTKTKKKVTSTSITRNPLTFKDILTCNSYVWYTVVFYCGVGAIIAAAAFVIAIIAIKKKKGGNK